MTRTFVDTGVLITAFRGKQPDASRALQVLDDPERSFASSVFVRPEALPLPRFHKRLPEVRFLEDFFDRVEHWPASDAEVIERAVQEAEKAGLAALDALHIAAALATGCDEIVTTQKRETNFRRSTIIRVRSL
jgi:predicted nucleic acid-binding protein